MSTTEQPQPDSQARPDPDAVPGSGPARSWLRVLAWASIVTAVVDVLVPALQGAIIPPLVVGAGLTIVGLVVLRRSWRAATVILGVVNLVLVLASAQFALPSLAHPASPLSFVHAVVGMAGGLLAVIAAVGAWRQASAVAARRLALVTVGVLAVAGVTATVASLQTPTATPMADDVTVSVRDFAFPDEVRVDSGDHVVVDNADLVRHTFTVAGTDLSMELPERTSVRVGVELPAGAYQLICAVPGHENMTTNLVVS